MESVKGLRFTPPRQGESWNSTSSQRGDRLKRHVEITQSKTEQSERKTPHLQEDSWIHQKALRANRSFAYNEANTEPTFNPAPFSVCSLSHHGSGRARIPLNPERVAVPSKQPSKEWEIQINSVFSARTVIDFVEKIQEASKLAPAAQHRPDEWFRALTAHFQRVVEEEISANTLVEEYWAVDLARVLYSFKQFSGRTDGISEFLSYIAELLGNEQKPMLDPRGIGNALYGLQNLASNSGTEKILVAIAAHIDKGSQLSPRNISNALYGLQKLTPSAGTEKILIAIAAHIDKAGQFNVQNINNALYGLQKLTFSVGTEAVLSSVAIHIHTAEKLDPQTISRALHGIRNFKSSPGVEAVLRNIAPHIAKAEPLTAKEIGNALYGLRNITFSEGAEAVLLAIAPHISNAEQFSQLNIYNVLQGSQKLTSSPGTEAVQSALAPHIELAQQLNKQTCDSGLETFSKKTERGTILSKQSIQSIQDGETQISSLFSAQTMKGFAAGMEQASKLIKTRQHRSDEWFRNLTAHFQTLVKKSQQDELEQSWAIVLERVLHNCKQFSGNSDGVSGFLSYLAELLYDQRKPLLSAPGLCKALNGLQNLTPSAGTERVLSALVLHIRRAKQLDSSSIGHALYGLNNLLFSAGTEEVLFALASHISGAENLSPEALGDALYGLKNFVYSAGTEMVLNALASHIHTAARLSAQNVGNALYGLQNLSHSPGTEEVLNALVPHIYNAEQLGPQNIGNALYGLQNHTATPGADALLSALAIHITKAERLDPQVVGNALYGLQNLTPCAGADAVLKGLKRHVETWDESPQPLDVFRAETVRSLSVLLQHHSAPALKLVNSLSKKFCYGEEIQSLNSLQEQELFLIAVLNQPSYQISLLGLSYGLVIFYVNALLKYASSSQLTIIYGQGSNSTPSDIKMKSVIEQAVANNADYQSAGWQTYWSAGWANFSRGARYPSGMHSPPTRQYVSKNRPVFRRKETHPRVALNTHTKFDRQPSSSYDHLGRTIPFISYDNSLGAPPFKVEYGASLSKQRCHEWETQLDAVFSSRTLTDFVTKMQKASESTKTVDSRTDTWFKSLTAHFQTVVRESPEHQLTRHWELNLARALYSCKQFAGSSEGISGFLSCLAELLSNQQKSILNAQTLCTALYGLQNLTCSTGTEAVLCAIAPHIRKTNQLSPQAISDALYGLQNFTNTAGVEEVLQALAPHIFKATQLKPQEIGIALFGLQNLIASTGVEAVLVAIAPHIYKAEQLSGLAMAQTLTGIQNLTSSPGSVAVRNALEPHTARRMST
ncbi:MAG: hypothetical protein K0R08_937 [Solimicrobium sp.]|jgi:hypothetical protein|nr:hypothetical protein [Solimicrobium sp.]